MNVVIVVYTDDPSIRTDVENALGTTLGGVDVELRCVATQGGVLKELDKKDVDCCIFDGEATPSGGMGLSKQVRDEYPDCPPVLLLVARPTDSWLATWSRAEAIHPLPIDPFMLTKQVEDLVFVEEAAA